jgi:hypothetical protein
LAKQIEGRYRGLIEEAVQEKERASNGQR